MEKQIKTESLMKKIYSKPVIEVINIKTTRILCGSGDSPAGWGGGFGQVPGLTPDSENQMA